MTLADKPSVKMKHEFDDDDDDDSKSKFFSWFSPGPTVCSARFAQPTQCLPGGASEDLRVEVDCNRSVSGFHLLFLR